MKARMQSDAGWSDLKIGDLSSRGLSGACADPPPRGAYIEVQLENCSVIGRVAWSSNGRFGLQIRERIDVSVIAGKVSIGSRPERNAVPQPGIPRFRRVDPSVQAERSRWAGMAFNFISLVALGVFAAVAIGSTVYDVLKRPLAEASRSMAGPGSHDGSN